MRRFRSAGGRWVVVACLLLMAGRAAGADAGEARLMQAKEDMVEYDLRGRGITNEAVLRAMRDVPREEFVPGEYRAFAYRDGPLPIGEGQTISQPYIVAAMTELLDPEPGHTVFEVGTGSGYQAAVLAELVRHVYSVEIVPALGERAAERLEALGYTNVTVRIGDGYAGWPAHAPFDSIIVTCGAGNIPPPLIEQLKPGGVMVIPVGADLFSQELIVVEKDGEGRVSRRAVMGVRFVPMTGEAMRP